MPPIYLDNNATTRPDPEVIAAVMPFLAGRYGNPSAAHRFGAQAATALRDARVAVSELIGARLDHEIVFTSGGTESNNTALRSALVTHAGRRAIVVGATEHPSVLALCDELATREGAAIRRIPVDRDGRIDVESYQAALDDDVAIVSVMWANNETGTLNPIAELAARAKAVGALFHTDAVQATGRIAIDLAETAIDMLSLSAHKIHGLPGAGALYVRAGSPFHALMWGGRQERRRRAGSENVLGIVALGKAAELARRRMASDGRTQALLRDRLENGICRRVEGAVVFAAGASRLPNTSLIGIAGLDGEEIVHRLDRQGIAVSTGAACAAGASEPSHVLQAMGVPAALSRAAVRFSLSRDTTEAEIDRVLDTFSDVISRARMPADARGEAGRTPRLAHA